MNHTGNIFLLIIAGLTLGSCAKNTPQQEGDTIRLTTSVKASFEVKAPLTGASEFTACVCGWEPSGEVDYETEPGWNSTAVIPAGASGAEITLTPKRNYHRDHTTYIRAWHPGITPVGGTVSFTQSDGSVDVLYTREAVSGSRTAHVTSPLAFSHLLTQIKFQFIDGGSWDPAEKIEKITLKNVALPASLQLKTGTLTTTPVPELSVPGINEGGITVGATAVTAGDPVMILPLNTRTFQIDVHTSAKTFTDVTISTEDPTFLEGRAYTATITLTKTGVIGLTATLSPWTTGTASGAIVD